MVVVGERNAKGLNNVLVFGDNYGKDAQGRGFGFGGLMHGARIDSKTKTLLFLRAEFDTQLVQSPCC